MFSFSLPCAALTYFEALDAARRVGGAALESLDYQADIVKSFGPGCRVLFVQPLYACWPTLISTWILHST